MAGGSRHCVKPARVGKAIVSRVIGLWDNDRKASITVGQEEFFEDVPAVSVNVSNFNFFGDGGIIFIGPNLGSGAMVAWISALLIGVAAIPTLLQVMAEERRSRSILVLDQSDLRGPFYYAVFSGLRSILSADDRSHITIYTESLDLNRFRGKNHEALLQRYLKEKYQGVPIGVVVAAGAATLELVLRWRSELWPEVPVVFAMVDEIDFGRLRLPDGVTGNIVKVPLADSVKAARTLVPDLQTVAFVGDAWDGLTVYRNWKGEIPIATSGLKVIDLVGQTMAEVRKQVVHLPDRSAIIYSAMFSDGEGTYYPPATAVGLVAEKANRPIVVAAETFLAPGGTGGFVILPGRIGEEAARLVLRILHGEPASSMAPAMSAAVRPVFNWLQMQRWGVRDSDLPSGSEIRFREPGQWEKYRWQTLAVAAVLLIQAGLIWVLLHERHMRADAERESRNHLSELAHANRQRDGRGTVFHDGARAESAARCDSDQHRDGRIDIELSGAEPERGQGNSCRHQAGRYSRQRGHRSHARLSEKGAV